MAKYSSCNGVSCSDITSINTTVKGSINIINGLEACSSDPDYGPAMTMLVAGFPQGYLSHALVADLTNINEWRANDFKPTPDATSKGILQIVYGKDGSGDPLFVIVTDNDSNSLYRITPSNLTSKSTWSQISFNTPPDRAEDGPTNIKQRTVEWGNNVWVSVGNLKNSGAGFNQKYYAWRSTDGASWDGISLTGSTDIEESGNNKIRALATNGAGTWWFGIGHKIYKSTDNALTWGTTAEHNLDTGSNGAGIRELVYTNNSLVCIYNYNDGAGTNKPRAVSAVSSDTTDWGTPVNIQGNAPDGSPGGALHSSNTDTAVAANGIVLFADTNNTMAASVSGKTVTMLDSYATPRDGDPIYTAATDGEGTWYVGSYGDGGEGAIYYTTAANDWSSWTRMVNDMGTGASPDGVQALAVDRYIPSAATPP